MPKDTTARNQEMKQDWEGGMPVDQIAQKHNLSVSRTETLLRGMSVKFTDGRRTKKTSKLNKEQLAMEYNGGKTVRELASIHGVAYSTMHRYLQLAGVQMRSRGSAGRR